MLLDDNDSGGEGRQVRSAPASTTNSPLLQETTIADNGSPLVRAESVLRKSILTIHNDPNLSAQEKARRVQDLMSQSAKPRSLSPLSTSGTSSSGQAEMEIRIELRQPNEEEQKESFHTARDGSKSLGCQHYKTGCKVFAVCCGTWHCCRFCHDEWSSASLDGHAMVRQACRYMQCMTCKAVQPAAQDCQECGVQIARYYCAKCKHWDDEAEKDIFHCDDCGLCRLGRREDYVHCNRCHGCLARDYHGRHKCLEGSLDASCPICSDLLFTSTLPVMFMRCGHAIHTLCFHQHSRESYQCPVCCKSIGDMHAYFRNLDVLMASHRMPPEFAGYKSEILCNDCERRGIVPFHFIYHKCTHCASYNTKTIRSFQATQQDAVIRADGFSEVDCVPEVAIESVDVNMVIDEESAADDTEN
jgi:hypothetical protein